MAAGDRQHLVSTDRILLPDADRMAGMAGTILNFFSLGCVADLELLGSYLRIPYTNLVIRMFFSTAMVVSFSHSLPGQVGRKEELGKIRDTSSRFKSQCQKEVVLVSFPTTYKTSSDLDRQNTQILQDVKNEDEL